MLNGTDTYSVLILAKDDAQDNYEEVDSLWEPDLPETAPEVPEVPEITPDENGKISTRWHKRRTKKKVSLQKSYYFATDLDY